MMFTVDCPRHGGEVLIWPSNIDGITNTTRGILVHYHCTCGHRGTLLTGRYATGARDGAPAERRQEATAGTRRSA